MRDQAARLTTNPKPKEYTGIHAPYLREIAVTKNDALQLLIIEDSMNEVEAIASLLRNAGKAVHHVTAGDEEELNQILGKQTLDLILCDLNSEEPTLLQVIQATQQARLNIPIIATSSAPDMQQQIQVMQAGARTLACKSDADHLNLIIDREIEYLQTIRELKLCHHAKRESDKRCNSLLDSSHDPITYIHEGMHLYANPAYLEMYGFEELDDIEGTPIMDMVAPENHTKVKDFLRRYSNGEHSASELEVMSLRPDGRSFQALFEFSPASIDEEPCTQIVIRDRSINEELEDKLKYLRKQDLLTGLYNRQYFLEEVDHALKEANKSGKMYGVFFIAPDNFRRIKENIGIAGSDLVLTDLAGLFRDILESSDIAARFSDNTFTILTKISDPNVLTALGEKIRSTVEKHICEVNQQSVTITVSIGINILARGEHTSQEIISQADLACEMSFKEGGNRVHIHNPVADEMAGRERDKQTIQLIQDAIKQNYFNLVYQPIASLHGDPTEKYEVLLRMSDSQGNEILPTQFIPIAEKYNLIKDVDRWVIRRAAQVLADRRAAGNDTMFFIKLSAASINDNVLIHWIAEQLKKYRLQGDTLCFEVFESVAESNLKPLKGLADQLHTLHCKLSIEHFGKGANSIQLLHHIPVDYLKIDGSFMHNLARNRENQAIIKSIAKMAGEKNITTITEFVEDASSLAVLWQCGVNLIQGNFLQKPAEAMRYDFQGEEEA